MAPDAQAAGWGVVAEDDARVAVEFREVGEGCEPDARVAREGEGVPGRGDLGFLFLAAGDGGSGAGEVGWGAAAERYCAGEDILHGGRKTGPERKTKSLLEQLAWRRRRKEKSKWSKRRGGWRGRAAQKRGSPAGLVGRSHDSCDMR